VKRFEKPSAKAVQAVQRAAARRLTSEELRASLERPMDKQEREDALALIRWFRRRYPTAAARLAYARRTARAWMDSGSPLGAPPPLRLPEERVD
jgi:hypothetical protein